MSDAPSRFAYPASCGRWDVSFDGSAAFHKEVKQMIQKEMEERKLVAVVSL